MADQNKKEDWVPSVAYLRSVTLKAAIRENLHYVDRDVITAHWTKANSGPKDTK